MSVGAGGLDLQRPPVLGGWRRFLALLGVAAIVAGWLQTGATTDGLELEETAVDGVAVDATVVEGVPVELWAPEAVSAPAPGVVVVHGFAGSRQLMRSTALALARAGYVVAVPDLSGHGANRAPLPRGDGADAVLAAEVAATLEVLDARPDVDGGKLGLLGHSLGSGAAMRVAIDDPQGIAATVAVSPTDAQVSPEAPGDLLLLAGSRERRFVANAEDLLERAGGASSLDRDAPARELVVVPGVEHVTILFSHTMHREAVGWFDAVFDHSRESEPSAVRLGWWYLLHLAGVLVLWRSVAPVVVDRGDVEVRRGSPLLGLVAGGAVALGVLAIANAAVELTAVGGMLVGPVLAGWLFLTGVVWLRIGDRPAVPTGRELLWAVLLAGVLIAAVGLLAPRVWVPFWPDVVRVGYVPAFALAALPFTLAFAASAHGRRGWRGFAWYLVVAVVVLALGGLAAALIPALSFVALVLPVLPLCLGLAMIVWSPVQRPWAAAIATAVLVGWLPAVTLPLA